MRDITFRADEHVIEMARARARTENTTLNAQFRLWLADYARAERMRCYDEAVAGVRGKVRIGRKLTRDEINER